MVRLVTERSWVRTLDDETIFRSPFIWIKEWIKTVTHFDLLHVYNLTNGRVDIDEWMAYKTQFFGFE